METTLYATFVQIRILTGTFVYEKDEHVFPVRQTGWAPVGISCFLPFEASLLLPFSPNAWHSTPNWKQSWYKLQQAGDIFLQQNSLELKKKKNPVTAGDHHMSMRTAISDQMSTNSQSLLVPLQAFSNEKNNPRRLYFHWTSWDTYSGFFQLGEMK